jgi:hypothetical protein
VPSAGYQVAIDIIPFTIYIDSVRICKWPDKADRAN